MKKENSTFTQNLFHLNEIKNNKLASLSVFLLGLLYLIIGIFFKFEYDDTVTRQLYIVLIVMGIVDIAVSVFVAMKKFDKTILKWLLLISITLSSGILYFLYPFTAFFITYGPMIICALYYDKKLVRIISVLNYILMTAIIWLNLYFESTNSLLHTLHEINSYTIWQYPQDVFLYMFVPRSIIFFITFYICLSITKKGTEMIIKNAEESSKNAVIQTELSAAAEIQLSSLPPTSYCYDKLIINAVMKPAKTVGGDFYDYFFLNDSIVILIADVSDKGLPAAMFMMKAKNAIRSEIKHGKTLEDSIYTINNILCKNNKENMFVTLWVAVIDIETGAGKYVNCGHPFPILRNANGETKTVENEPDIVLGLFDNYEFKSNEINLNANDTLFLYTDGFTDCVNNNDEFFGTDNLKELIKNSENNFCVNALNKITKYSSNAEQFDDITALSLTFVG